MVKTVKPAAINTAQLAQLANLTVTPDQARKLDSQFTETLVFVNRLNELDTAALAATPQVTNLKNIFRSDSVLSDRQLTQAQALANASHTSRGFFVVPRVGKVKAL